MQFQSSQIEQCATLPSVKDITEQPDPASGVTKTSNIIVEALYEGKECSINIDNRAKSTFQSLLGKRTAKDAETIEPVSKEIESVSAYLLNSSKKTNLKQI